MGRDEDGDGDSEYMVSLGRIVSECENPETPYLYSLSDAQMR